MIDLHSQLSRRRRPDLELKQRNTHKLTALGERANVDVFGVLGWGDHELDLRWRLVEQYFVEIFIGQSWVVAYRQCLMPIRLYFSQAIWQYRLVLRTYISNRVSGLSDPY